MAAETLSSTDGCDAAFFVSALATEAVLVQPQSTTLALTDNHSLYNAVSTTNQVEDRRLRVDISALRELQDNGELQVHWIPKEKQLADVLTKKGVPTHELISVLREGHLVLPI